VTKELPVMAPNSFIINTPTQNSVDMWGLKVISHDVFSPPKRETRKKIPFRSGSYISGYDRYYDDRTLRMECQLTRQLSKSEFREIVYVLSLRNSIFIWDEPEKYYRAELYESVDVDVFPKESGRNFTLPFICDPFAYGPQQIIPITDGNNPIEYKGTAESPTLIIIRNPNPYPVSRITLTAVQRIKT